MVATLQIKFQLIVLAIGFFYVRIGWLFGLCPSCHDQDDAETLENEWQCDPAETAAGFFMLPVLNFAGVAVLQTGQVIELILAQPQLFAPGFQLVDQIVVRLNYLWLVRQSKRMLECRRRAARAFPHFGAVFIAGFMIHFSHQ